VLLLPCPPLLVAGKSKEEDESSSLGPQKKGASTFVSHRAQRYSNDKDKGQDRVQIVKGYQGAKGWVTKIEIEVMFRVVRHRDSGQKADHGHHLTAPKPAAQEVGMVSE
jgi:hypothetical protein